MAVSRPVLLALLTLAGTAPAATAQDGSLPHYRDDRSTAEAVVESLYNAVGRREYLRAWSYFRDEPDRPTLESFVAGYADTAQVRVRVQPGTSDGAAGSIYHAVPTVVEATRRDGSRAVYAGCYELRQVQPAAQIEPPFRPIGIVRGTLAQSDASFDTAEGVCTVGSGQ